jgi:hypothetical protein
VSPLRGRPGHLAVTSAVQPCLRFFRRSVYACPPLSFLLPCFLEPSESINSRNSWLVGGHLSAVYISTRRVGERKKGPHSR